MAFKQRNKPRWEYEVSQKRLKNLRASTKQELQKILKEIEIVKKYYYSNDQSVEEKNKKLESLGNNWVEFNEKVNSDNKMVTSTITETDSPNNVGVTFSTSDNFHNANIIKPSKKLFDDLSCNQFLKDIKSNEWYWVWTGDKKIEIRKTAPELKEDDGKIGVVKPKEKYWGRVVVGEEIKVNKYSFRPGTVLNSLRDKMGFVGFAEKIYLNLSVAITPSPEKEAMFENKSDKLLSETGVRYEKPVYKKRFGRYNDMFASIEAFYPKDNTACKLFRVKVDKWIQTLITQVKQDQNNANKAHPFNDKLIEKVDGQNEEYTYKLIIPGVTSFNYVFGDDKNKVEYDTDENRKILDGQTLPKKNIILPTIPNMGGGGDLLENVVLKF